MLIFRSSGIQHSFIIMYMFAFVGDKSGSIGETKKPDVPWAVVCFSDHGLWRAEVGKLTLKSNFNMA
jgi:hypothetical protein